MDAEDSKCRRIRATLKFKQKIIIFFFLFDTDELHSTQFSRSFVWFYFVFCCLFCWSCRSSDQNEMHLNERQTVRDQRHNQSIDSCCDSIENFARKFHKLPIHSSTRDSIDNTVSIVFHRNGNRQRFHFLQDSLLAERNEMEVHKKKPKRKKITDSRDSNDRTNEGSRRCSRATEKGKQK